MRRSIIRFRPRLGIRSLLIVVAIMAVFFGYVAVVVRQGVRQAAMVEDVISSGGTVTYDDKDYSDSHFVRKLRNTFGDNYFGHVRGVGFVSPRTDSAIESVESFPKLTHLTLARHYVSVATIERIAKLPQLKSLELLDCSFDEGAVSAITLLSNSSIESLSLAGPSVDDQVLERVSTTLNLRELHIFSFSLDGASLQHLDNLATLETLRLDFVPITNTNLKWIADNLSLNSLALVDVQGISDEGLKYLTNMKSLQRLLISECPITSTEIASIKSMLPNCDITYHVQSAEITDREIQ